MAGAGGVVNYTLLDRQYVSIYKITDSAAKLKTGPDAASHIQVDEQGQSRLVRVAECSLKIYGMDDDEDS